MLWILYWNITSHRSKQPEIGNVQDDGNYSILYTLYSILYTLYSMLYTLYSILYTLCSILNTLYSILYTLYSILYTLYSILYTLYSILYTLYSILYTQLRGILMNSLFVHAVDNRNENCYFWGNTNIVFTPTGKTALPGKDIMDIDL